MTHYNNGDEIPNLTINNDWTSASIGAYSDYDNNPTNSETYGRLYNWYTVNYERGICPEGYHVPTDDEYSELEVYLGMSESETNIIGFRGTNEGSKLAGNSELWNIGVLVIDPEFGTSGFNALPAGFRVYSSGDFDTVGKHCYYWSSSENSNSHAWYRNLLYFNTRVYRNSPSKQSGFSIRCLGDEITTGCTEPEACNYDETATSDDGSCEYNSGTLHVSVDGDDSNCGSAEYPIEHIQAGIDAASDGDSVLVSAGTYFENIIWPSTNGIKLIGSGEDDCIIDGGSLASVIRFEEDLDGIIDSTTLVTGFTLKNGYALDVDPYYRGGGMYLYDSSPALTGITFSDNEANSGGGMFLSSSNPTLIDVTFSGNTVNSHGGGMYLAGSNPTLIDVTFSNNAGGDNGGGMSLYDSSPTLTDVTFSNNAGGDNGGGMYLYDSSPNLTDVTFSGNTAGDNGGGMFLYDFSNPTLTNSILWGNSPQEIYDGESWIVNSITITYSDIQGGEAGIVTNDNGTVAWLEGNIDDDPIFVDSDNGDYNLGWDSPCIDTGDPDSDLDPDGTIADMGAYYFEQESNCIDLHEGTNLISFSTLPLHGPSDFPECIGGIIGEGIGAAYVDGSWIGSLTELSCEDGYWVVNYCEDFEWCYNGTECSEETEYALHLGNNLISYTLSDCGSVDEVLPDDVEECIYGILGEGFAALNTDFGWIGTLTTLCPNDGYWFISECDIDFTYDEPTTLARRQVLNPSPYPYNQSSKQAFYFIESVENIEIGDWIIAYNGDEVIGAREWTGDIIDVPAMGDDGSYTKGYIETGEVPSFKILRGDELIDLEGDIPAFENNQLYMVSSLTEAVALPETFSLDRAYPNPFNPTTTLSFALPVTSNVLLEVYDINGRLINELIKSNMDAGYHSVIWNADNNASGVYFVKMVAGDFVNTQKLMLVK